MTNNLREKIISYFMEHPIASIEEISGAFYSASIDEVREIINDFSLTNEETKYTMNKL